MLRAARRGDRHRLGRAGAARRRRARWACDGVELLDRVGLRRQEPGRAATRRPVIVAARERGLTVLGELELAWRLLPNPLRRGHRHQRQDHHHGAARGDLARGGAAGGGRGQRRARRSRRWSGSWTADARSSARCRASSSRTPRPSRPTRALLLNLTEDHLDRHGTRGLPRGEAARVREPDAASTWPSVPTGRGGAGPARAGSSSAALPLPARARSACAARTTSRTRMGAAAAALASGVPEAAVRPRCATFAGRAAPARGGRPRRRRALRERLEGHERRRRPCAGIEAFDGGVHVILGGSLKGGGFAGLREALAARCRGGVPDRRGGGRSWQPTSTGSRRRCTRCGDLATARCAAAPPREPGEVVLLVARLRQLRPVPRLRGARRALPAVGPAGMNPGRVEGVRMARRGMRAAKRPVEYSILYTATLCLLAAGAVMVYSASSAESLLSGPGDAVLLPEALRDVRAGRPGGSARWPRGTGSRSSAPLTPLLLVGVVRL